MLQVFRRFYWSGKARAAQSLAARAKRVWEPIRSAVEGEERLGSRLTEKKNSERLMKPAKEISVYLQNRLIGRPRTPAGKREAFLNLSKRRFSPSFLGQLKPSMRLLKATVDPREFPPKHLPEIAVVGRSNVGKSTLLNSLCGRGMAQVSARPGSTRTLNFFAIGKPPLLSLVDLPGYGFADGVTDTTRIQWTETVLAYLGGIVADNDTRRSPDLVLLLIDGRWGFLDSDIEMLSFLKRKNKDVRVVLTKCDLVADDELAKRIGCMEKEMENSTEACGRSIIGNLIIPVSAKRRQGMEKLRELLDEFKLEKKIVIENIKKRLNVKRTHNQNEALLKRTENSDLNEHSDPELKDAHVNIEKVQNQTTAKQTRLLRSKEQNLNSQKDNTSIKGNTVADSILAKWGLGRSADGRVGKEFRTQTQQPIDEPQMPDVRSNTEIPATKAFTKFQDTFKENIKRDRRRELSELVSVSQAPQNVSNKKDNKKRMTAYVSRDEYIGTTNMSSEVKGIGKWKILGRPASKAPRLAPPPDVKDLVNAREPGKRKKNMGFEEAQSKLQKWVKKGRADPIESSQGTNDSDDQANNIHEDNIRNRMSLLTRNHIRRDESPETKKKNKGVHNVWLERIKTHKQIPIRAPVTFPRMGRVTFTVL